MIKPKMLAIYGSPRKNGNSDSMMDSFVVGARKTGIDFDLTSVRVRDNCIKPCMECNSCVDSGKCCIKDDMMRIYRDIEDADIVVVSSPIFFYSVTAQLKALIDRCQALWAKNWDLPNIKSGYFLSCGATSGKKLFAGAKLTMRYFFDAINADYSGSVFEVGVDAVDDILDTPALIACRNLGHGSLSYLIN